MKKNNETDHKVLLNKSDRLRFDLILTENCTLKCKYCYETMNRICSESTNMTFNVIRNTVDFAYDETQRRGKSSISFVLFGGEPMLNPEGIKYFAKYLVEKDKEYPDIRFYITTITNGTIFNRDLLDYLLSLNRKFVTNIHISLDGIPEVQDKFRPLINGEGSSKIISENIKKYLEFFDDHGLDAYDMGFLFHSTFTRNSLDKLYENFVYCIETLGFPFGTITPVVEDRWTMGDEKILDDQLNKIFIKSQNEYKFSYAPIKPMDGKIYCFAGRTQLMIAPNGDIFGCPRFYFNTRNNIDEYNKFKMGNVNKKPYLEDKVNVLEEARKEFDMCDTGNHCKICMGGNYEITGHLTSIISPFFGIITQTIQKYSLLYSSLIDNDIIEAKGGKQLYGKSSKCRK